MKNKYLLLCLLLVSVSVQAQQTYTSLTGNNVNASATSTGDLFNRFQTPTVVGYEFPAGSDLRTIYAANLWVGGVLESGEIVLAAEAFQSLGMDWFNGPLTNDGNATITPEQQLPYNTIWSANRNDIIIHNYYFESLQNGTADENFPNGYVIPDWFLTWPAHANVADGFDFYLAPFFDFNANAVYDPENGDYPLFCGDQCLYFVINDKGGTHTESGGQPIGIEVRVMMYSFNELNNPALQNTVFVKYEIINRSNQTIYDTYFGAWGDFDIGGAFDDYVGTNVMRGAILGYNADSFDEPNSESGGYADTPPVMAIQVLAGPRLDVDGEDNPLPDNLYSSETNSYGRYGYGFGDGIIDNEHSGLEFSTYYNESFNLDNGDPYITSDFYSFLTHKWRSGETIYYGGDGILGNPGVTDTPCDYVFPGVTDPLLEGTSGIETDEWSETTAGNIPDDRRMIASSGPFTFMPGAIQRFDLAFTAVINDDSQATLEEMDEQLKNIKLYYDQYLFDCVTNAVVTSIDEQSVLPNMQVYPNPAHSVFTISVPSGKDGYAWSVIDLSGREVLNGRGNAKYVQVSCDDLAHGTYILQVKSRDQLLTQKIVIE